jgi:hypothetical protein
MARRHLSRERHASAKKSDAGISLPPHTARSAECDERSDSFIVTDDFPAKIAISPRELDVIEAFLGTLLDDILK